MDISRGSNLANQELPGKEMVGFGRIEEEYNDSDYHCQQNIFHAFIPSSPVTETASFHSDSQPETTETVSISMPSSYKETNLQNNKKVSFIDNRAVSFNNYTVNSFSTSTTKYGDKQAKFRPQPMALNSQLDDLDQVTRSQNREKPQKNHHPSAQKPEKTPKNNPSSENAPKKHIPIAHKSDKTPKSSPKMEKPQSWASIRSIISCKHLQVQSHQPQQKQKVDGNKNKKSKTMRCSGSLCNNTKVMQRPDPSSSCSSISISNGGESSNSTRSMKSPIRNNGDLNSSSSSFMVMPFRRFSGCYECRMVVDPVLGFTRDPSLRATICTCPQCGEIFMKAENLELHQAVSHAVSELGADDTSKNIVEIIFQSSWLKKQTPVCTIDRILKVQNTPRTISKFEAYRDSIKAKSSSSTSSSHHHQRCLADGNELLRFHATSLLCSLGIDGSSNLCSSMPNCHVCSIIKNGLKRIPGPRTGGTRGGILTTATSGRAHDSAEVAEGEKEMRAMLVCRVIAGRVRKEEDDDVVGTEEGEYDSVAGAAGAYSNLDELYVFSPRAILPCFVVVYRGF